MENMRHANKDNDNGAQIVKGCKAMHRDRAPSWIMVDRRRRKKDFCQEFLANVMEREREMENGKLTRLPIDANANDDDDDDGSAKMWAMRENKGNELKAKDNTGKPSYTWPRTIGRESTGDAERVWGKKGAATVRNGSEKLVILLIV